ncbi:cell division protein ZapA [Devosia sp.]|uniref:cell division protein ZapA n=1 Tax=Devosia sp. TaxID=1871048 RepID=UPI003A94546F
MPEVNVEINGRRYRMACEEGQEQHLLDLAAQFNSYVDGFKGDFGEIGDNRLTVMAGIAVVDELAEAQRRIESLKQDVAELTAAGEALSDEADELERRFAKRLNEAARKIESIATVLDETGAASPPEAEQQD